MSNCSESANILNELHFLDFPIDDDEEIETFDTWAEWESIIRTYDTDWRDYRDFWRMMRNA